MPWLTGTAFLHSIMVQQRRGMLKTWNVSLVLATGLPRHPGHVPRALGRARVDPRVRRVDPRASRSSTFVSLLAAGSIWLVLSRRDGLRSEHRIDSLLSREAVFLLNNLVLVGCAS